MNTFLRQHSNIPLPKFLGKGPFLSLRETIEKVKPLVEQIVFIWKKRLTNELLGGTEDFRIKRRQEVGRMIAAKIGGSGNKKRGRVGGNNSSVTVTEVDEDDFLI